jgi:CRISPR-associated protein Csx10
MAALHIEITVGSALCAGAGTSRPGVVDREVNFDSAGLPYIPGKTLKGLLRDAYRQLLACGCFSGLPEPDAVFGKAGQKSGAALEVGNARLKDAAKLGPWLRALETARGGPIARPDVVAHYTEIRRQTAIDRASGAPDENTLRATRTLRKGADMVFHAPLSGLPANHEDAVALAAAALQQMGTARTRGFGEVTVRLRRDGADLTAQALEKLEKDETAYAGTREAHQPAKLPEVPAGNAAAPAAAPQFVQRFRLTLDDPLLCASQEGDANLTLSEQSIPGAAIRGALASRALRTATGREEFYRIFCSGAVKFLSANPETEDGIRALPVPHSMRQSKRDDCFLDLARMEKEPPPSRRYAGWTVLNAVHGKGQAPKVEVKEAYHFHHARAGDPRVGRALGAKYPEYGIAPEQAGQVFTYQSVEPGQKMSGALLGSKDDLEFVRELVGEGEVLRLGRSRNAQYGGGAVWHWEGVPESLDHHGGEAAGWADPSAGADAAPQLDLLVTLLSPLVTRNENGHPAAEFPKAELAENLGLTEQDIEIKSSWVRVIRLGGYLAHQRLPRQQEPALAAGSVFLLHLKKPPGAAGFAEACRASYGLRTEDGLGRLSIETAPETELPSGFAFKPSRVSATASQPGADSPELKLARAIFLRQVTDYALNLGVCEAGNKDSKSLSAISNSLLHRMTDLVARNPVAAWEGEIGRLRDTAANQLRRSRLHEFLNRCSAKWEEQYSLCANKIYNRGWNTVFPKPGDLQPEQNERQEIVRQYVIAYLQAIAWRKREERNG